MINKFKVLIKERISGLFIVFLIFFFCFQTDIISPKSGFGEVKKDKINPFGEIKGIIDSYNAGEIVKFEIQANDNDKIKKIIFQVLGTGVKLSLIPRTPVIKYNYSFTTKGWENKAYIYTLLVEDMSSNTWKYQGIFFLKSPKTEGLDTRLTSDKIIKSLYSLGKGNEADFLHVSTNKEVIRIGEFVSYHFRSEKDCYLLLINIGADGNIVQLFPNGFNPDHHIKAYKRYVIPEKNSDMKLEATGPPGTEKLLAIVSETPFNLFPTDFSYSPYFILDKDNKPLLKEVRKNIRNAKFLKISQQIVSYLIK